METRTAAEQRDEVLRNNQCLSKVRENEEFLNATVISSCTLSCYVILLETKEVASFDRSAPDGMRCDENGECKCFKTEEMCYRWCTGRRKNYLSAKAVLIWHLFFVSAYTDKHYKKSTGPQDYRELNKAKEAQPPRKAALPQVHFRNMKEYKERLNKTARMLFRGSEQKMLERTGVRKNRDFTETIQSREDSARFTIEAYVIVDSVLANRLKSSGKTAEQYATEFSEKHWCNCTLLPIAHAALSVAAAV
ncbi:uncharacterized protein [Dermacentor albipictus]|uniref:uncharacterized protein n=1 Tax=Dermacentor albipictus TaxID=60249 RepID=UPI0038FC566F